MILVIGDKHYPSVAIDELSIRHTLALQRELVLTDISSAKTFADVKALVNDFKATPPAERQSHPEGLFLTALAIWAARTMAGEEISLLDAVDVPVSSVKWVPEPHDREEPAVGKGQPRQSTGGKGKTSRKK